MEIHWLKLPVIHLATSGLTDEEISEVEAIKLRNEGLLNNDEIEIIDGYFNLGLDSIIRIVPKCFIPKGKARKKYYSEIVFDSGGAEWIDGKPEDIYKMIEEYVDLLPDQEHAS